MDSIRIIQLPTKSAAGTDDYIAVDSTANGTKKIQFPNFLDNGLTIQNKAADAKATGDAISEVNGAIGNEASTRQSADANLQTQINQIIAPSGEAPSAAEVQNARIGAPPESTVYPTLGDAIRGQVTDLKSDLTFKDITNWDSFKPSTAKIERLYGKCEGTSIQNAPTSRTDYVAFVGYVDGTKDYCTQILAPIYPPDESPNRMFKRTYYNGVWTSWETFSYDSDLQDLTTKGEFKGMQTQLMFDYDKNLLDKSRMVAGYVLNTSTGNIQSTSGNYSVTNYYIPVTPSQTLYFSYLGTAYEIHRICGYDENKKFVSGSSAAGVSSYTVPSGVHYVRLDANSTYIDGYQLEYGAVSSYVPFGGLPNYVNAVYVSTDGNDINIGDKANPLATITEAIRRNANRIYVESGTYNEQLILTNVTATIIGYGGDVVITGTDIGTVFKCTNSRLTIENICATGGTINGFYFVDSIIEAHNCKAYNNGSNGFRMDGSNVKCYGCVASENGSDGFNAHDTDDNSSIGYFYDCISDSNSDDGLSYHENGRIYVFGGEYLGNSSGGVTPFGNCHAEIHNAYIHNNDIGVYAFNSTETAKNAKPILAYGNIINNNRIGIKVSKYDLLGNCNCLQGNTIDTEASAGDTITLY